MAVIACCCALLLSVAGGPLRPATKPGAPLKPATPPAAADAPPFLMDVNDVYVVVDVKRYPIPDPNGGLKVASLLENLIQTRLEKAKIRVRTSTDPSTSALRRTLAPKLSADADSLRGRPVDAPILSIGLNVLFPETGTRAALYVETSMARPVRLVDARGSQFLSATIWSAGPVMQSVMATRWEGEARKIALQQVESFLAASRPPVVRSGGGGSPTSTAPAASKAPVAPTSQTASASAVVASRISSEFHRPDCPVARVIGVQSLVTYKTREEALSAGKRPCKSCNP